MKIAQFVNTLSVADGGPARNSFELNLSLNRLDSVEANLFCAKGDFHDSVVDSYENELGPLPVPGPRWIKKESHENLRHISMIGLARTLRHTDVSIIHGYYLGWIAPLTLAHKIMGVPYVITPHGSLTSEQQKVARRKKAMFDQTLGRVIRHRLSSFITGSQTEALQLSAKFPRSHVAVGGVGTSLPTEWNRQRQWQNPLRLLSLSRIAPKKRIDLSIRALASLKERQIAANLLIVGDGPAGLVADLQALAAELGISQEVQFMGQKTGKDKHAIMNSSDMFLFPSDDENFGIGLAEALAHGLPAITSTSVAAARFMTDACGKVLPSPSGPSIASAIEALIASEREACGKAARACAAAHYSWRSIAENWATELSRFVKD